MSNEEKLESGKTIGQAIPHIMALAEAYPELKANENFGRLMGQLESVENDIANARKYYNGTVRQYNTTVQTIPTNIIANMFGFHEKMLYEVESTEERENVHVSF